MAVSNYLAKTQYGCRYNYSKLKDRIYLVSDEHLKSIHIDNGEAYISAITTTPTVVKAYGVTLEDSETLDERHCLWADAAGQCRTGRTARAAGV